MRIGSLDSNERGRQRDASFHLRNRTNNFSEDDEANHPELSEIVKFQYISSLFHIHTSLHKQPNLPIKEEPIATPTDESAPTKKSLFSSLRHSYSGYGSKKNLVKEEYIEKSDSIGQERKSSRIEIKQMIPCTLSRPHSSIKREILANSEYSSYDYSKPKSTALPPIMTSSPSSGYSSRNPSISIQGSMQGSLQGNALGGVMGGGQKDHYKPLTQSHSPPNYFSSINASAAASGYSSPHLNSLSPRLSSSNSISHLHSHSPSHPSSRSASHHGSYSTASHTVSASHNASHNASFNASHNASYNASHSTSHSASHSASFTASRSASHSATGTHSPYPLYSLNHPSAYVPPSSARLKSELEMLLSSHMSHTYYRENDIGPIGSMGSMGVFNESDSPITNSCIVYDGHEERGREKGVHALPDEGLSSESVKLIR